MLQRIEAQMTELRRVRRDVKTVLADCDSGRCRFDFSRGRMNVPVIAAVVVSITLVGAGCSRRTIHVDGSPGTTVAAAHAPTADDLTLRLLTLQDMPAHWVVDDSAPTKSSGVPVCWTRVQTRSPLERVRARVFYRAHEKALPALSESTGYFPGTAATELRRRSRLFDSCTHVTVTSKGRRADWRLPPTRLSASRRRESRRRADADRHLRRTVVTEVEDIVDIRIGPDLLLGILYETTSKPDPAALHRYVVDAVTRFEQLPA